LKNDSKQELTLIPKPKRKRIEYTVRIGNHLYQRISRHLLLLKHLKNNESKQNWIQEAVKEKLAADELSKEEVGDRFLHLKLDVELWSELEKKVESLKATRTSVSKKVLIEEAIFEKLDREEQNSKKMLKKMLDSTPED
jgi:hypothetical protein